MKQKSKDNPSIPILLNFVQVLNEYNCNPLDIHFDIWSQDEVLCVERTAKKESY